MRIQPFVVFLWIAILPWSTHGFVSTRTMTTSVIPQHPTTKFFLTTSSAAAAATVDDTTTPKNRPIFESFGKGVARDFGNRWPDYITTDWSDGANAQTLATIFFLFFACLAPAIGFGSLCDIATKGQMGAMEFVLSTSLSGILYALLSPQPIGIIGPTGPNLAFTVSLYGLAQSLQLPFLPLFCWTGLWTSGLLALGSLTSLSHVVQYLTRFTDEIFNVLLSVMFIFDGLTDIFGKTLGVPVSVCSATRSLLTILCSIFTFVSATILKGMIKTKYFTKRLRKQLSNFAPAIAVVAGSLLAKGLGNRKYDIALDSLNFPTTIQWKLVSLSALPNWARFGVALPSACLATLLMFLTQNITSRLNNNPNYKMSKGKRTSVLDGMHGDLLVLSGVTALSSLLGLPWMVGATTRSAAHVRSLLKISSDDEGSSSTTSIERTLEQRVSGLGIHLLMLLCMLRPTPRQWLGQVPLPVLSGILLYLGFTSLQGLDFWNRIQGLAKWDDTKTPYTTRFTIIQLIAVAALMKVTKSQYGVLSPLIVALLPLVRKFIVKRIVPETSLNILDPIEEGG